MKNVIRIALKFVFLLVLLMILPSSIYAQTEYENICKEKVQNSSEKTIVGENNWLFLRNELSHISKGEFHGDAASNVAVCTQIDRQDPVPAIVDFNDQLKKLGIRLYLVPVPPKALVNADKVDQTVSVNSELFSNYSNFYSELTQLGVSVIDLFPIFTKEKKQGKEVYCQQDSHWNPKGIDLASKAIANNIQATQWHQNYKGGKNFEKPTKKEIVIKGDLLESTSLLKEKVTISTNKEASTSDEDSPVLVIGDSHCLVFHSGKDMHAENAGILGNLAMDLGLPIDMIAVKGSGVNTVRIDLYRKAKNKEWLSKKKVIVWCFAARDFTESQSGWRKIPVIK